MLHEVREAASNHAPVIACQQVPKGITAELLSRKRLVAGKPKVDVGKLMASRMDQFNRHGVAVMKQFIDVLRSAGYLKGFFMHKISFVDWVVIGECSGHNPVDRAALGDLGFGLEAREVTEI